MSSNRIGKVSAKSLASQARDRIRDAIFKGAIQPDERLTIEQIAAELGISRTPVREALKALEADGIVRLLPHRGAVVQRFDEAEISDRYSVRAILEGFAGELACQRRGAALAKELEDNCAQAQRLIDRGIGPEDLISVGRLVELNDRFHHLILDSSDSTTTMRILDTLRMPVAYRVYHWGTPERQARSMAFHRKIGAAFAADKPKQVRKLLEEHLLEARDFLLKRG
jgi:DNA-binding GntR family transcriptional regulator